MRRLMVLLAIAAGFAAQAQTVIKDPGTNSVVTPDSIGKRFDAAAQEARNLSPNGVQRASEIDIYWPRTADEYRSLGKFIIVLVSVVTRDPNELPVARLYIRGNNGEIALEKIGSERRDLPKDTPQYALLGGYREDGFYLAPAGAMIAAGTLLADMKVNRTGLRIYVLPGNAPEFIRSDPNPLPSAARPDGAVLKTILAREYPGFNLVAAR